MLRSKALGEAPMMNAAADWVPVAKMRVARNLTTADLKAALAAGWGDFTAFPAFGLAFAGIYVFAGLLIASVLFRGSAPLWLVPAAAGFPLLGPFVAVGLYEVSRRREQGLPMRWQSVFGALRGRGDEQILSMGVIVFVAFAFWLMVAHGIFAVFLSDSGLGDDWMAALATPAGLAMLAIGSVVGALMALAFYAITVISLPMLVDREVDFLTAIIVSIATVRSNSVVMIGWAAIVAVILFAAMLPLFLGLFVALPVLGHATWHLYRRAVV
jgi:uncharacterized membrane protein